MKFKGSNGKVWKMMTSHFGILLPKTVTFMIPFTLFYPELHNKLTCSMKYLIMPYMS